MSRGLEPARRARRPGRDPIWLTLLCGIGGAVIGLVVRRAAGGSPGVDWTRWIVSVAIAAALVVAAAAITGRTATRR